MARRRLALCLSSGGQIHGLRSGRFCRIRCGPHNGWHCRACGVLDDRPSARCQVQRRQEVRTGCPVLRVSNHWLPGPLVRLVCIQRWISPVHQRCQCCRGSSHGLHCPRCGHWRYRHGDHRLRIRKAGHYRRGSKWHPRWAGQHHRRLRDDGPRGYHHHVRDWWWGVLLRERVAREEPPRRRCGCLPSAWRVRNLGCHCSRPLQHAKVLQASLQPGPGGQVLGPVLRWGGQPVPRQLPLHLDLRQLERS
mmetsp:Transcript_9991/g.28411  ORF Transcript_9991/g.28411 Transcript_9991/m.28411 type:complete len:249 (+) Transcript_9991:508-1254(+)